MDTTTLKELAKTELHCHLDGSISLETIRQLADMADIAVPAADEDLKDLVTAPAEAESLMDYLKAFDFVRPLCRRKKLYIWLLMMLLDKLRRKMSFILKFALHLNFQWMKD